MFEEEHHIAIAHYLKDLIDGLKGAPAFVLDIGDIIDMLSQRFKEDNELFEEDKFRSYIYGEE